MRHRSGVLLALLALAAAPATAGWKFQQTMKSTSTLGNDVYSSTSDVQIEGADARIAFVASTPPNPMFDADSYMLIRGSAPKGMFLVDTKEETYARFDPEELAGAIGSVGQAMQGAGLSFGFEDVKFEKLSEQPGGEMQGVATTHTRIKKSYVMVMTMANMRIPTLHEIVEDVWWTRDLAMGDPQMGEAFRGLGGGMVKGLEESVEMEKETVGGFPIKRVTVDHSTPQGKGMMARMMGKEQTTTTTLEVLDLQRVSIPAETFVIPRGYTETEMMQPAGAKGPDLEDED
jgi:hypothetical protein